MLKSPLLALVLLAASPALASGRLQTAIFAGGCFWTMEHGLETIPGVVNAVSGYTGGAEANPTYEQVSSEETHHVEAVKVTFNPDKISYAQLVDRYWRLIDPTDSGGQACDRGPSYHTAVFVNSPDQRRIALASRAAIDSGPRKGRLYTPVLPATTFWPAEDYHQHFTQKNPLHYEAYRVGCGRDAILKRVWGQG
jgi:peptide-methionine (S)-S-oxide reductase